VKIKRLERAKFFTEIDQSWHSSHAGADFQWAPEQTA